MKYRVSVYSVDINNERIKYLDWSDIEDWLSANVGQENIRWKAKGLSFYFKRFSDYVLFRMVWCR